MGRVGHGRATSGAGRCGGAGMRRTAWPGSRMGHRCPRGPGRRAAWADAVGRIGDAGRGDAGRGDARWVWLGWRVMRAVVGGVADVCCVGVFVVLGRASHAEGETVAGVARTLWPFLAGWRWGGWWCGGGAGRGRSCRPERESG
ncbi:MAG TPA: DUF3054 domain-containing protein [Streptosporangiaceae bacterium]|nr:DUF3054 domain-containing protein [Streptosporangiaceae bacterium]